MLIAFVIEENFRILFKLLTLCFYFTGILVCIIVVLLCLSYGLMIYHRRRHYSMHNPYGRMA